MIELAIGHDAYPVGWLHLMGAAAQPPFRTAQYQPGAQPGEQVREKIVLTLEGSASQIADAISALETRLHQGNIFTHEQTGAPLYLKIKTSPADAVYRARILDGALEMASAGTVLKARGSCKLILHISRHNWFDTDPIPLIVANNHGFGTLGVLVFNHRDGQHFNEVGVEATDFSTDLPAPVRMTFRNATSVEDFGSLHVGSYQDAEIINFIPEICREAEEATGGSLVTSGSASGGAYKHVAWYDAGLTPLLSWVVASAALEGYHQHFFRPVLRLAQTPSADGLFLCLRWLQQGVVIHQSAQVPVQPGQDLVFFPPQRIPPQPVPLGEGEGFAEMQVQLCAQSRLAGTHQLDVDHLTLLPLDCYASCQPIAPLAAGATLIDDAFLDECLIFDAGSGVGKTYQRQGRGLYLQPGKRAVFLFIWAKPDGSAPIDMAGEVKFTYRRRKRIP